jgi:hypothetical protein
MSCPCNKQPSNRFPGINKMPVGTRYKNNPLQESSLNSGIPDNSAISVNRNNYTGVALPFGVRYFSTSDNFNQEVCINKMSLLPNGPLIPTTPIMPAQLPPVESGGFTSVNTQYLCVRRIANICNLQANQVFIDSGRKRETSVVLANLPEMTDNSIDKYYQLVVNRVGKVMKLIPTELTEEPKTKTRKKNNTDDYFSADMYTKLISLLSKKSNSDSQHHTQEPPLTSDPLPPNLPSNIFN